MNKSKDIPLSQGEIEKHISAERLKQGKARRKIEDILESSRRDKEFELDC